MTSPKKKPLKIVLVVVVLALAVAAVVVFAPGPFSKLEDFPADAYVARPGDFLGNRYLLRGQIDTQIAWEPELGRLIAVRSEAEGMRIPVFLPAGVLADNPRVGQRYKMRVRVKEGGLVAAEQLTKF